MTKIITVGDLKEILAKYPESLPVCKYLIGNNFPIRKVESCIYNDWDSKGHKTAEHDGLLID